MRAWLTGFFALLLTACQPAPLQEQQAFVFGTRVEVVVVGSDPGVARQAIASVLREFDRLHRAYHAWQPSELSALNNAVAAGRPQVVSKEMLTYLRQAQTLSVVSDGLFDPGIGNLIKLWGFQSEDFASEPPSQMAINAWLIAHPGMADLRFDGETVSSRNKAVAVDFGGYLKGVALDRAASILREQGIRNALINIGGNVMALGDKAGRPWRIGIQHPRQPGPLATLELADGEAIGTSGDYQRYFEKEGRRYSHLLDPRSGYPASETQAITLLIPAGPEAGMQSDALSKPLFIAGREGWQAMRSRLGISRVLRVDRDGHIEITAAMRERLHFPDTPADLRIVP